MMVLPVAKALELEEFPKHEDVKQHLVEWQPSMGNVAFFSHTWLSWTHPDGAHHGTRQHTSSTHGPTIRAPTHVSRADRRTSPETIAADLSEMRTKYE